MTAQRGIGVLTAIIILAGTSWLAAQQAPPRDAVRSPTPGTPKGSAVIAGRVMTPGSPAAPVRRATVTVSQQTGANYGAHRIVTNDDGSFEVTGLPAGRYFVTAAKPAYLPAAFGSNRPPRMGSVLTGTAVPVEDGQRVTDITLAMTRGGVVTGTIRDTDGRPARGATVALAYLRRSNPSGERVPSGTSQALTDSRGVYRIFGVAPGSYVLMAGFTGRDEARDAEITTDADVRRLNEMSRPGYTGAVPAASASTPRRPTVGYAPVYYPGTTVLGQAQTITIAPGEERSGVDVQIQLIPNSRVEGTVTGLDNRPVAGVRVWLAGAPQGGGSLVQMRSAITDAQGAFRMTGMAPGHYVAEVRPEPGRVLWGRTAFSLVPDGDTNVQVMLQPSLTASGRFVFEPGGAAAPDDLSKARVFLTSDTGTGSASATVAADGRFTATGLIPDRFRVSATVPGVSGQTWYMKSATIAGQDAVDAAVDLRSVADLNAVVITMTDRVTEISGVIQDGKGQPAPEYFIVVFPLDRALWAWNSRRILQTRPARDGKFSFRNLPAGEYLIGAVTDVEQNEWFEPAFLEMLYGSSARIAVPAGGRVVQDLRIRR